MISGVSHGRIELIEDRCTSCMICVRECPTWCITIDSTSEVINDAQVTGVDHPGQHGQRLSRGRERTRQVLQTFEIDWALCMYCGLCIEECPFDALAWAPQQVAPAVTRPTLVHGRTELAPGSTTSGSR